jgi:hypothetical protein
MRMAVTPKKRATASARGSTRMAGSGFAAARPRPAVPGSWRSTGWKGGSAVAAR